MVANQFTQLFIDRLPLESRVAIVDAVAALATHVPVANPFITGVVKTGEVIVWTHVNVLAASVRATVKLASGRVIVLAASGQLNVNSWLIIGIIVFESGRVQVLATVAVFVNRLVIVLATLRNQNVASRNVLSQLLV